MVQFWAFVWILVAFLVIMFLGLPGIFLVLGEILAILFLAFVQKNKR